MTCDELRCCIEEKSVAEDVPAVVEHLEGCAKCRQLMDDREELSRCLQIVRCSAPDVPAALDLAVAVAYRQHVQRPGVRAIAPLLRDWIHRGRPRAFAIRFGWTAVAAALVAAMLVAGIVIVDRKAPRSYMQTAQPKLVPVARPTLSDSSQSGNVAGESHARRGKAAATRRHFAVETEAPTPSPALSPVFSPAPVVASSSFSAGFQNLMYCDSLSCGGDMEVIRMQLPAFAMNRDAAARQTDGFVLADVLVGQDGIARAIRIVK